LADARLKQCGLDQVKAKGFILAAIETDAH
jgi:hypothetical protein